jgi:hypothetical protein
MRAWAKVAGAILVCALAWPAGAGAATATASSHCGRIVFEPQTDNAAVNIHARGTSCRRARRIVRAVYNSTPPFGYRCRSAPTTTVACSTATGRA